MWRSILPLVLGLVIGGAGAFLFQDSLPAEEGSTEARVAELEAQLQKATGRVAALEATEKYQASLVKAAAGDATRTIVEDVRAGRPVDLEDVFRTAKPALRLLAPLMDRARKKELKRHFESLSKQLADRYKLDDTQRAALKKWMEDKSNRDAAAFRDLVAQDSTGLEDMMRASRDVRPDDGLDEFMGGVLTGDALKQFKTDRMADRVKHVQYEADGKVARLDSIVDLDPAQEDQVFSIVARSSRDYDPGMQFEGVSADASPGAGQTREEAILSVLRPEQRQRYDAARAERRAEAEKEMYELGLKLPPTWDMFE